MRLAVAAIAVGIAACGSAVCGTAHAQPLTPDYAQQPNGAGYDQVRKVTPGWSPIQIPTPDVTASSAATIVVAHPYLSPWLHDAIPVPAGTEFEVLGAAKVSIPGVADGAPLVVRPEGHCLFDGASVPGPDAVATHIAPVRVDTPVFQLVIEPTVRR